jgi:flagellar FliL protein
MSEKKAAAAAAPPAKGGGKLKWIIIAVVVLAAGGGGAFMFLKPGKATGTEAEAKAKAKEAPHVAAQYYKFDPAFVVNFGGEGNSRFLQLTLEAMSRDPKMVEEIKANEPAIRNDLVLLYSSQQYETLVTEEGKAKLREQTLAAIRKIVAAEGGKPDEVENVYFTSFVIQ